VAESPAAVATEFGYVDAVPVESFEYLRPMVADGVAALPAGAVILDLGCGNGALLASFRASGHHLHGLDSSTSGIDIARRTYPGIDFDNADLTADILDHPLTSACDLVISTEVVEHLLLPRPFARNCYRFLKPGGRLIISTPYHGYLKNLALAVTGSLDGHFTALWDYGHVKFWSRKTLSLLLEEAGFTIESFHGAGRFPLFWKSMVLIARKPAAR
jgi:2-polyprenyl-3-methyl-5-hydroxy-6-metoxy-1,4-benzoquinol methylase